MSVWRSILGTQFHHVIQCAIGLLNLTVKGNDKDELRSGPPHSAVTERNIVGVKNLVKEGRYITL